MCWVYEFQHKHPIDTWKLYDEVWHLKLILMGDGQLFITIIPKDR